MRRIEGSLVGLDIEIPQLRDDLADVQPGSMTLPSSVNGNLAEIKAYCSDICGPQRERIQHLLGAMCAREALLPESDTKTEFVRRSGQLACVQCAASRMSGGPVMIVQRRLHAEA